MSRHAVLIFACDPLAAALLGGAVELSDLAPFFANNGETARAALLRVRPRILLIDCDHEEACSDEFVGPAMMTGAHVLLFKSRRTKRDMGDFANRLELEIVEMPLEHDSLTRKLGRIIAAM